MEIIAGQKDSKTLVLLEVARVELRLGWSPSQYIPVGFLAGLLRTI